MKIKDLGMAATFLGLLSVMWIIPFAVGQLGDRHDTEALTEGKVTVSSGDVTVTLSLPEGFERVAANSESSVELIRDRSHVYLNLSSGADNQEVAIERGLVVLGRTTGPASWTDQKIRIADTTPHDGRDDTLIGKACRIEGESPIPCAVVGAVDYVLTVVSTDDSGIIDDSINPVHLLARASVAATSMNNAATQPISEGEGNK